MPPHAVGVWHSATDRALPWPPAAGISARRHSLVDEYAASTGRLLIVRKAIESLSTESKSMIGFGGGITWAMRESCSGPVPMWKSAPSGPATSSAKNVPSERPETRLTISPSRYPWLIAW